MLKILKVITALGPNLKQWIWSDGKFHMERACILLAALIVMGVMYSTLGEEGMRVVLSFLDEFSDTIGYAE